MTVLPKALEFERIATFRLACGRVHRLIASGTAPTSTATAAAGATARTIALHARRFIADRARRHHPGSEFRAEEIPVDFGVAFPWYVYPGHLRTWDLRAPAIFAPRRIS